MSHINIGRWQLLYWPRWRVCFARRKYVVYLWIVYVWPIEVRLFAKGPW